MPTQTGRKKKKRVNLLKEERKEDKRKKKKRQLEQKAYQVVSILFKQTTQNCSVSYTSRPLD